MRKDLVVKFDLFAKTARSSKLDKMLWVKETLGWSERLMPDGSILAGGQKQALEGREGLSDSTAPASYPRGATEDAAWYRCATGPVLSVEREAAESASVHDQHLTRHRLTITSP